MLNAYLLYKKYWIIFEDMNMDLLLGACLLVLFSPLAQAVVTIDDSLITKEEHQKAMKEFQMMSLFAVPSTKIFTLQMNQAALKGMSDIELNKVTNSQQNELFSLFDHTPSTSKPRMTEKLLEILPSMSEQELHFIEDLFSGNFTQDIAIQPDDEEFEFALALMLALKSKWEKQEHPPPPQIEELNWYEVSNELEEHMSNLTGGEEVERSGRAFHSPAAPLQVNQDHIKLMMSSVFTVPRDHESGGLDKLAAYLYVGRKLDSYGLMVINHVFSAAEYLMWYDQPLQGNNVIGVLAGRNWGTEFDRPVILGAHLDTVPGSPGLNDNGSGLAAMLETARVLADSGCAFQHSIFFVAFDLEEIGTQGSAMFVKDYLVGSVMNKFGIPEIAGAYVVDCIANWEPQPNSQDFPTEWKAYLPDNAKSLESNNYTGDFAAMIYRKQVDSRLANVFSKYYSGLGSDEYRLELMGLEELGSKIPDASVLKEHFDFIRSDHVRFWWLNDTAYNDSMPAVLLTDMGPFRGIMRECYHKACDVFDERTVSLGMVKKVTQALVWSLSDLALAQCGPRGRLSAQQLFVLMGGDSFTHPSEGISLTALQNAMELLHFLGILPLRDIQ